MPPKKRTSAGKAKAKPSGDAAAPDPPFSGADAAWKEVGVRVERIKKAGAWVAAGSEPTGIPGLSSLPSDWEGASVPISDVRPGSKASLVPSVGRIQNDPGMLRAARCWKTSTGAVVAMAALQGRCCHWRTSPRPLTSTTLRTLPPVMVLFQDETRRLAAVADVCSVQCLCLSLCKLLHLQGRLRLHVARGPVVRLHLGVGPVARSGRQSSSRSVHQKGLRPSSASP